MAEFEVKYEVEGTKDGWRRAVGIFTACIAILVSVISVLADHYRDESANYRERADEQWSYYESKDQLRHNAIVAGELISALTPNSGRGNVVLDRERHEAERYGSQTRDIQERAREYERERDRNGEVANKLSLGIAALNLATVLSSIYFISGRKFFPIIGGFWLVAGLITSVAALLPS